MKVAIYSRFSTDLQDRTSIAGQIANCEALAGREGLEIVARFQDEGRSGNDDSRAGYQTMLAALKHGDFAGILTDETSRITRNQAELHRLVAELRFRDQFLITCDGIDTRSEASEIILSVKAAIDQMEGRKIGLRTYRSLRERHKDGNSAGGRIYGYTSVDNGDYRRRVVDEEQAEVVREIFERYAAGEGAKSIARDLNNRGVPSPGSYWNNRVRRALGWTHTTLSGAHTKATGILRNPVYTGRHTWNKRKGKKVPGTAKRVQHRRPTSEWIEVQDESLRIVSDELFKVAQKRLEASRVAGRGPRGRPARYLLSGLLKCGCCGSSYVMANGRNYRCSSHTNARDNACDQGKVINRKMAEERLLAGIKEALLEPKLVKTMAKQVRARLRQIKQPDKRVLANQVKRIEQQIDNVVESLSEVGRSDALTAKLRTLESEKAQIEAQLSAAPPPTQLVPDVEKLLKKRVEVLEDLPRVADPEMIEQARMAVKAMLGEVKVFEEGTAVYAEVDLGRAYINRGAEERT